MVLLVPHDPRWPHAFETEARALRDAAGGAIADLHHIGSTAVPGLIAKPVIDLLGVAPSLAAVDAASRAIVALGYQAMGAFGIAGRRYFRKIDATGRRTHHLHVFASGSPHIERHLAFRDYLRAHPDVARAYADAKTGAAGQRDYQDAKAPFVVATERSALGWYRQRA